MRIAIIGSHGTGKTTLAKWLTHELKMNLIPDVVPEALRLGFTINESSSVESQLWILTTQLELERNTKESWVSEKALWDNYIYGSLMIKDLEAVHTIKKVVERNVNYDFVFYLPIEFPIFDDGKRSMSIEFQKKIDSMYRYYLDQHLIQYFILTGSLSNRLNQAIAIINN